MTARLPRVLILLLVLLTVAGCTGVPGSSGPQVVKTIGFSEAPPPSAAAPAENAAPLTIFEDFRKAMTTNPDRPDVARAYLDEAAAKQWSPSTVTVVQSGSMVVLESKDPERIAVTYQTIGALSADGIYTPSNFTGSGAAPGNKTYFLVQNANRQWRITSPVPAGLFITDSDFLHLYAPKSLYFPDTSGTRLVPDLRYSALRDASLETFLLAQLAKGPRPELADVVAPIAPLSANNQRLSITPGSPNVVQVPGASALDDAPLTRLAAQLALTLRPQSFAELQIHDGNQTVTIPGVGDTFDFTSFAQFQSSADEDPSVTYVHRGAVVDGSGTPLGGKLGTPVYALDSAVFDSKSGRTLVAGTTGPLGDDGRRRLLVGDTTGLRDVGVPSGPLTTPVWAPQGQSGDTDEVWVASRNQIYRFAPGQKNPKPVLVSVGGQTNLAGTTITSMSFSAEGVRLLLVIRSADGSTSQVWVASVNRTGPDVQLSQLQPVTPTGYDIADAAWRNETQIAAVGTSKTLQSGLYLPVAVDGSQLGPPVATEGLPDRPLTIAASPRSVGGQWVTVGTGQDASVWNRASASGSWSPPIAGASLVEGYAPSFSTG